jgi:hypothetical protein
MSENSFSVAGAYLNEVTYSYTLRRLILIFQDGRSYVCHEVPSQVFVGLVTSDQHNDYFSQSIVGHFTIESLESWLEKKVS